MDGINFLSGLRDQNFGEKGAQGSKKRQENRDQWVPDIPCYDPAIFLRKRKPKIFGFENAMERGI